MEAGSIVLMDLLWSDPTENDSVEGLRPNARGPRLPDRVMEFCNNNDLQLIRNSHDKAAACGGCWRALGGLRRTNNEQKLRCGSSWVTWSRPYCDIVMREGYQVMRRIHFVRFEKK
ncbi:serine/threonine-protein phosphatase BSL3-like protein [Tanacetum coccineum]|uniref:Serine/threonine-protein phosphatase BSL3-like protein n=1 Tax=Tanacetum coccineum TaxID=301880 RepID=A0ABQ5GA20_9ASTR